MLTQLILFPGFIALIVCLSVLILGLFVAIFILLRDYEPTDEDRAIRRQLSQRHREQRQSDLSFTYAASSANPLTLTQKIGGMFGMDTVADQNSGGQQTKKGNKSGHGWIQASGEEGDEWDADMDGETEVQTQFQKNVGDGIKLTDRSITKDGSADSPFRPPQLPYAESDSSSCTQDLYNPYSSFSKPIPLRTAVTRLQTEDSLSPSSPSFMSGSSAPRALSGSPEPYATGSVDDLHNPERQFSGGTISTRTSHTGTKFIESLE
jgi:hypothetical protein